jgi:FdhD protein
MNDPTPSLDESTVLQQLQVLRVNSQAGLSAQEWVAVEKPVAIEFNGISHAVMLASPANFHEFALGFALTEGIIASADEMYECEVEHQAEGVVVKTTISSKRFAALKDRRRNLTGRTGCGLCGVETIDQAVRHPSVVTHHFELAQGLLVSGMKKMHDMQPMHHQSGATHAAAWMDLKGEIKVVREDVGRHNALDKLMGHLALEAQDFSQGVVLITSRASFEMVQKCAAMGVGLMAAISAPTSLAVSLAQETGVTLIGYMRQEKFVIYANPQRVLIS